MVSAFRFHDLYNTSLSSYLANEDIFVVYYSYYSAALTSNSLSDEHHSFYFFPILRLSCFPDLPSVHALWRLLSRNIFVCSKTDSEQNSDAGQDIQGHQARTRAGAVRF